jgi:LysR family transcriptional regulator, transcriptional activator of the cysJI operon
MISKIDLYRIFLVVSKSRSFSKAAEQLYMTQPAVSQSIAKLEQELNTSLFYRTPKGVSLTNEGKVLHDYVNQALGILDAGEHKMLEFRNLKTGTLRIGVGDTISRFFLLPYLEAFHTKYPGIRLKVMNGTTKEIMAFVKAGEADVGICNLPVEDDMLDVKSCKNIHDIFVCGHKYVNLTKKPIQLSLLMKMPLIFLEKKANSRNYVEAFLKEKGYDLAPEFELGSHDLLLQFAKINLGIACVTKEFAEEEISRGELFEIPLVTPVPKRSIGIVTLKTVPTSHAAQKFIVLIDPLALK